MRNKLTRLLYIDNIRTFIVTLVILVHVAVTYGPVGIWYYYERTLLPSTYFLGFFASFSQAFFMGLLFMVSAYFMLPSYNKKGANLYIRDRLKRLGIPLLFFTAVIGPFLLYIQTLTFKVEELSFASFYQNLKEIRFFYFYYDFIIKNKVIEMGPLWFVFTLLIFTLILIVVMQFIKSIKKVKSINWNTNLNFPQNYKLFISILVLAIATFLVRLKWPIGSNFYALQFCFFPQYIFMFIAGILAYINNWFEKINHKKAVFWLIALIIAILSWPFIIFFSGAFEGADITILAGGFHWQAFMYALWESVVCVSISIVIIYYFREKLNKQNKFFKTLADSAYTVYIIHPLIIIPLAYALMAFELHPLFKFLILSVIGVPLSFLLGTLIKRIPFLKKIL
jgi:surface polysaccharide O-acyltransferase-like enzyme